MTNTSPAEAVVHVDIDADPNTVWEALATDDGLASWIGEGSTVGNEVGDEIRVHDVVTGRDRRGYLDEVTPGRRLGYTWWPDAEPDRATRVAISLEPTHTGTRVTVIESQPMVVAPVAPVAPVVHGSSGSPRASAIAGTNQRASSPANFADWTWRLSMLCVSNSSNPILVGVAGVRFGHG